MAVFGKIIGTSLGFVFGGPLGALLGVALGHQFDRRSRRPGPPVQARSRARIFESPHAQREMAFAAAFAILLGKLCHADGHVSKDERDFLRRLNLSGAGEAEFLAVFNAAQQDSLGPEPYARQLVDIFGRSSAALEKLLETLIFVAAIDGVYHPAEREFIHRVTDIFGIAGHRLDHLEALAIPAQTTELAEAYQVLGVEPSASNKEIRQAYRAIVRENHPDFATAQGMPDDFVEVCNQILAKSNAAYDIIKVERGMS